MTHSTELPAAVVDYFDMVDRDEQAAMIRLFAPDAHVTDDGHTYRGHAEIVGWLGGAASEFTTTSTRLAAEFTDRSASVVVRVEGNFPGGLVDLRNEFTLDDAGLISMLSITA